MKYLLDTHVAIWAIVKHKRIPQKVIELLSDSNNQVYYSTASIWETEIKHLKYPMKITINGSQLAHLLNNSGANNISISNSHVFEIANLKIKDNRIEHNDPFDKLLLAQAITEKMVFITADKKFLKYDYDNIMII